MMDTEDRRFDWILERYGMPMDIGSNNTLQWATDGSGMIVGALRRHRTTGGSECATMVFFGGPAADFWRQMEKPMHTVLSWEPFTLDPVVLCGTCGSEGFIQNNSWVPV